MKKLIFIIIFLLSRLLIAQVTQEWVATYNGTGSGYNFPKKSAIDKDGNFITAGNSEAPGGYDYVILKYSPSGNLIWQQRYNGIGNGYDYLMGMVLDDSGNVYVTGESDEGISLGGINWVTIKYKSNGQMLWKKSLNWIANNTDEPLGMNIDKERNIYVVGFGKTSSAYRQMITLKYSSNGDSLWTKVYRSSPSTHDWGYSIVTDDSLNVYSSGYGIIPTGNEIVTIKYDQSGNEKWIRKYPTFEGDYMRPTLSAIDSFNNIILIGYQYTQASDYDFVTLKYSPEGDLLWNRLYDGGDIDYANSLTLDEKSNILICGSTFTSTFLDYLILKYSPIGDTLLIKVINQNGTDQAYSITTDTFKNIYVTGYSQPYLSLYYYRTVKLNSKGDILWTKYYHNIYDDFAYNLCLDNYYNVYVAGEGEFAGGNTGIVIVKYSQFTKLMNLDDLNLKNYHLENYPNPFNSLVQIKFQIPKNSFIKIIVYDVSGKEIKILVNESKEKGHYKILFNCNEYPSGVYFYSLISNGITIITKRMLLIK